MFAETHDAILLAVAGLYLLIALIRATQPRPAFRDLPAGWLTIPLWVAFVCVLIAILW